MWDSWEDDAFIRDKASGRFFDPGKHHDINHRGEHFRVKGPLNVARPVQGHPVVVQAGQSEDGRGLAAASAEVIFTAHQSLELGPGLLPRHQGARARGGPRARACPDHAGRRALRRPHRSRGAGEVPAPERPHRPRGRRSATEHAHRRHARPQGLPARRAAAPERRDRRHEEPAGADPPDRRRQRLHDPPALPVGGHRARAFHHRRERRAGGRRARGVVRERGGGRLQHPAPLSPRRARGLRRPWWSPSCSAAGCSGRPTRAGRCARTSACRAR